MRNITVILLNVFFSAKMRILIIRTSSMQAISREIIPFQFSIGKKESSGCSGA
jgi:hypothetical protein